MIGFLVKAGLFYIVWQVIYELVIFSDGRLDQFLEDTVAILAKNDLWVPPTPLTLSTS